MAITINIHFGASALKPHRERFDRHGWNRRILLLSITGFLTRLGFNHTAPSQSLVSYGALVTGVKRPGFYQGIKVLKSSGNMARHFDTITIVASLRVEGCEARNVSGFDRGPTLRYPRPNHYQASWKSQRRRMKEQDEDADPMWTSPSNARALRYGFGKLDLGVGLQGLVVSCPHNLVGSHLEHKADSSRSGEAPLDHIEGTRRTTEEAENG